MNSARPDISKYAGTIPYAYRVKVELDRLTKLGIIETVQFGKRDFKLTVKNASKLTNTQSPKLMIWYATLSDDQKLNEYSSVRLLDVAKHLS